MTTVSNSSLTLIPVKDVLNFDSTVNFENKIIKVSDLNVRLIKSFQNTSSINISNLKSGVYMLEIETEQGVYKQKIIKK